MAMGMVQAFFYQQKLSWGEVEICSHRGSTGGVLSISGLSSFVGRLYSKPQPKERTTPQPSFSSQRLAFLRENLAVVCVETGFDEAPIRDSLLIPAEPLEHYEIGF
jgi:hypothetical protein